MKTSPNHLPSLFGSLLFVFAALLFLSGALLVGVTTLSTAFTGKGIPARQTIIMIVAAVEGLILLAATFISIQKFLQKESADKDSSFSISVLQIGISLLVIAAAIWIGDSLSENLNLNWAVLPILTIPAVILPIFIILGLGIRKLPLGPRWQSWNVFGLGMTLTPFFLVFIEVFGLILILVFVVIYVVSQPSLLSEMEQLTRQMNGLDPQSTAARELLLPWVMRPAVLALAMLYVSLIVPIVEELLKPLGVWLFSRRLTSRAQGFALGALSGAAYALIETLGVSPQTTGWGSLLLTRIGTDLLHITTSALMGAAIVSAIQGRKYLQLLGTYILSVSLHGLWNALAILYTFSALADLADTPNVWAGKQLPLSISMGVLAAVFLIILVMSNRKMKASLPFPLPLPLELPADDNRNEVKI
jgi:hypothetical protein